MLEAAAGFIGRARDLEELEARFRSGARLVTLLGTGGIGKTSLALELLARLRTRSGLASAFVDLTEVTRVDGVLSAIADAAGLSSGAFGEAVLTPKTLVRALASRGPMLLVLDNFEHLTHEGHTLVAPLLDEQTDIRCLVTSRVRTDLPGEVVHELGPLEPSDALEVLTNAVRRVAPSFPLTPEITEQLASLAGELDGIPLALELAAPAIEVLGVARLASLLQDSLQPLKAPSGTRRLRHQSLTETLEWSWGLLEPAEQRAAAMLSVCCGSCDLSAAAAVLGTEGWPADFDSAAVIQSLRRKSFVVLEPSASGGSASFRQFLTVRSFCRAKLDAMGEFDAVLERHFTHFARRAEERAPRLQRNDPAALAEGLRDYDNCRWAAGQMLELHLTRSWSSRALRMLSQIDVIAAFKGTSESFSDLATQILTEIDHDAEPPRDLAALYGARGRARFSIGRTAEAADDLRLGVELATRAGDLELRGHLAAAASRACLRLGLSEECLGFLGVVAECASASADPVLKGEEHRHRGDLARRLRHGGEAEAHYEEAIMFFKRAGDERRECAATTSLACVRQELTRFAQAKSTADWALTLADRTKDVQSAIICHGLHGFIHLELGEYVLARAAFEATIPQTVAQGDRYMEGIFVGYLGQVDLAQRKFRSAGMRLEDAVRILDGTRARYMRTVFAGALAATQALLGEPRLARATMEDAKREAALLAESERAGELLAVYALLLDRAPQRAATEPEPPRANDDLRIAHRLLREVAAVPEVGEVQEPPSTLLVAIAGSWFVAPNGRGSELRERPTLARILASLATARSETPGQPIRPEDLIAAGWPDDRILPDAAKNRLRVAISTLRKLGLGKIIVGGRRGYYLDPRVPLVLEADHDAS